VCWGGGARELEGGKSQAEGERERLREREQGEG